MSARRYGRKRSSRSEGSGGRMNRDQRIAAAAAARNVTAEAPVVKPRKPGRPRKSFRIRPDVRRRRDFYEAHRWMILFLTGGGQVALSAAHAPVWVRVLWLLLSLVGVFVASSVEVDD